MKKKTILRGLLGFPLGIALGHVITIIISLFGDGTFYPTVPTLTAEFEHEISAVIFQTLLTGTLGAATAAASVIWEMERWSIAKQTGIHFLVLSIALLPIAYFSHWMDRSVAGFILYFAVFVAIFIFVWLVNYAVWWRKIKRIDRKVKERK
jgi:hypothetical protein